MFFENIKVFFENIKVFSQHTVASAYMYIRISLHVYMSLCQALSYSIFLSLQWPDLIMILLVFVAEQFF